MLQLLWCSDGATSTFALRAKMRECEVAKAKLRRCEGEGAKVRRCESESAKAKERYYYRPFPTSHSGLRIFARSHFRLFDCIQQASVDYIEFYAGTVLARGLPIHLRCY